MCGSSPKAPAPSLVMDTPPIEETLIEDNATDDEDVVNKLGIQRLMIPLGSTDQKSGLFIPGGS